MGREASVSIYRALIPPVHFAARDLFRPPGPLTTGCGLVKNATHSAQRVGDLFGRCTNVLEG